MERMSTVRQANERDPFWSIVEGISLSPETFALLDAVDDKLIRANR